jgi:hypothetical protein
MTERRNAELAEFAEILLGMVGGKILVGFLRAQRSLRSLFVFLETDDGD